MAKNDKPLTMFRPTRRVLFLDTTLTPELEAEGLTRELIRRIQSMRKDLNLQVEDKIITTIQVDSSNQKMLQPWVSHLKTETRSQTLTFIEKPKGDLIKCWQIDQIKVSIGIKRY